MNRRNLLIGASAVGLAAFAAGTIILNRRREAEAEALAIARDIALAELAEQRQDTEAALQAWKQAAQLG